MNIIFFPVISGFACFFGHCWFPCLCGYFISWDREDEFFYFGREDRINGGSSSGMTDQ